MKVTGDTEVFAMLKGLADDAQRKILRPAIAKGAEILKAFGRMEAPVKKGHLRNAIEVKVRSSGKTGTVRALVGEFNDSQGTADKVYDKTRRWYASFVMWGHKIGKRPRRFDQVVGMKNGRPIRKKVFRIADTRKEVPGNEFLDRAFAEGQAPATQAVVDEMQRRIEKLKKKQAVAANA